MRQPIRVMVASDSAVIRRLVSESLLDREDDEFEVYPAIHGGDALLQLDFARPHVLILGTEMPVMNGIQTVRAVRENDSVLPILMLCLSNEAYLKAMIESVPAGANDCAKFTLRMGHVIAAKNVMHDELVPKIRFWANHYVHSLVMSSDLLVHSDTD